MGNKALVGENFRIHPFITADTSTVLNLLFSSLYLFVDLLHEGFYRPLSLVHSFFLSFFFLLGAVVLGLFKGDRKGPFRLVACSTPHASASRIEKIWRFCLSLTTFCLPHADIRMVLLRRWHSRISQENLVVLRSSIRELSAPKVSTFYCWLTEHINGFSQ